MNLPSSRNRLPPVIRSISYRQGGKYHNKLVPANYGVLHSCGGNPSNRVGAASVKDPEGLGDETPAESERNGAAGGPQRTATNSTAAGKSRHDEGCSDGGQLCGE